MPERVQWIEYKEKKILFSDFSKLIGEQFIPVLEELENKMLKSEIKKVLMINDVTGSSQTPFSINMTRASIKRCEDAGMHMIVAIVGITGVKRSIANMLKKESYFAINIDDAKEWLYKQTLKDNY